MGCHLLEILKVIMLNITDLNPTHMGGGDWRGTQIISLS